MVKILYAEYQQLQKSQNTSSAFLPFMYDLAESAESCRTAGGLLNLIAEPKGSQLRFIRAPMTVASVSM